MLSQSIMANYSTEEGYNEWLNGIMQDGQDYESPFSTNLINGSPTTSAVTTSNIYRTIKQRKPMVIEYYEKPGDTAPKSITMYINPERLQISNQKLIGKQVTRGGIFYHHYGPDHSIMSLNGSTGLSGMAGIKQLEEMYYASGTLLRYQNFTPTQVYENIEDYEILDYKDPIGVIDTIVNGNYDNSIIENAKNKLDSNDISKDMENTVYTVKKLLRVYENNDKLNNFINKNLPSVILNVTDWETKSSKVDYRNHYQKIIKDINLMVPNISNQLIVQMAYELSQSKLHSNMSSLDKKDMELNYQTNVLKSTINFNGNKQLALKKHIEKIKKFKERDEKIRKVLENNILDVKDEFLDEWLPRQMIIYFDNRSYIGHFDTFTYNMDAKTNLITYDMKFTITKQYQFNNGEDPNKNISVTITPEKKKDIEEVKLPIKDETKKPVSKPNNNLYKVVRGDTLYDISKKFYGDISYWSEIYAANLDKIKNVYYGKSKYEIYADIYPGMELVIPKKPSGYRNWVVIHGDTLRFLAEKFYHNGNNWRKIYNANRNVINRPDHIEPKWILKIPL